MGGQGFWKLSVEFDLVGMCPRLRMVHQSARLKNIDGRKALDTPWPPKEENQPGACSSQVWSLCRETRGRRGYIWCQGDRWGGGTGRACGGSVHYSPRLQFWVCICLCGACILEEHNWNPSHTWPLICFTIFFYKTISVYSTKNFTCFDLFI